MKGWTDLDPDLDGPLDKPPASSDPDPVDRPAKGRSMRFKWIACAAALSAPIILMMSSRPRPEPPPSQWPIIIFGDGAPRRVQLDASGEPILAPTPDAFASPPMTPASPGPIVVTTPLPPPWVKVVRPPQSAAPAVPAVPLEPFH